MKLVLTASSPWPVVTASGAPSSELPCIMITPVEPAVRQAGRHRLARVGLAPGDVLEIRSEEAGRSSFEWPVTVIEGTVRDGSGKAVGERLVVVYCLIEYAAAAVFCCQGDRLEQHRAAATKALLSGRPDTAGDISSLASLFAQ